MVTSVLEFGFYFGKGLLFLKETVLDHFLDVSLRSCLFGSFSRRFLALRGRLCLFSVRLWLRLCTRRKQIVEHLLKRDALEFGILNRSHRLFSFCHQLPIF